MRTPEFFERRLLRFHAGEMPTPDAAEPVGSTPESVHEQLTVKHRELQQRIERASTLVSALQPELVKEWNASLNRAILSINAKIVGNQQEALELVEHWLAQAGQLLAYEESMKEKQRQGLGRFNIEMRDDLYYIHIPYGPCGQIQAYIEGPQNSYRTFAYEKANNGWKWPVRVKLGTTVKVSIPNRNGCWSQIALEGRFGALNLHTLEAVPDAPPPAERKAERREWNVERSNSSAPAAVDTDSSVPAAVQTASPVADVSSASADTGVSSVRGDKFDAEVVAGKKRKVSYSGKDFEQADYKRVDSDEGQAEGEGGGGGGGRIRTEDGGESINSVRTGEGGGGAGGSVPESRVRTSVAPDATEKQPEIDETEQHLENVSDGMRAQGIPEREIRIRIQILRNVSRGKTYFPAGRDKPEVRNPQFWRENDNGSYVSKSSAVQAIRDLWETSNGIQCNKYSRFIMIKTLIDNADEEHLKMLDELFTGIEIPNDLPSNGMGLLFENLEPKNGEYFAEDELLPGDQIWFENPYMNYLTDEQKDVVSVESGEETVELGALAPINKQMAEAESAGAVWGTEVRVQTELEGEVLCKRDPQKNGALFFKINGVWEGPADVGLNKRYRGEQGSNLFYAGDGKVMGIYDPEVKTINTYRRGMFGWNSVKDRNREQYPRPSVDDFQIKGVRRMNVSWHFVEYIVQQKRAFRDINKALAEDKSWSRPIPGDQGLSMIN